MMTVRDRSRLNEHENLLRFCNLSSRFHVTLNATRPKLPLFAGGNGYQRTTFLLFCHYGGFSMYCPFVPYMAAPKWHAVSLFESSITHLKFL